MTMKKILLFSFSFFLFKNIIAQKTYFQQEVNYTINAKLDDRRHKLTADISIEYTNNSPDPLSILYFHLWANAFDSKKSAYAKQQLRNNKTDFYFANEKQQGGYSDLDFKIDGKKCEVEIEDKSPDIAKLTLATPLASGQKITITTPFTLKIPYAFSRIGHIGQQYLMTQWYPKPAVYDAQGWHQMPYLDQGEFYAEFGSYDVSLTLPENYVVGATGVLQTDSEKDFLAKIAKNMERSDIPKAFGTEGPLLEKKEIKSENDTFPKSSETLKTIRYKAEKVHDFAWFTDKRFLVQKSEVALKSGKKVETYTFFTPKNSVLWSKSSEYINRSVKFYSDEVGEYPHPQASAVMSDAPFGGGMEYPMITVISGEYDAKSLDIVIAHEVGHNWFQGILASNERDHSWMDEGLNSFYEHRYDAQFYPPNDKNTEGPNSWFFKGSGYNLESFTHDYLIKGGQNQPATLTSDSLTTYNFFIGSYIKPSLALEKIEKMVGSEKVNQMMQAYFRDWQFKHPQPDDFYAYLKNLDKAETTFKQGLEGDLIQKSEGSKPLRVKFGLGVDNPNKTNLYWSPLFAANKYDGVMFGLTLYNGILPNKKFEWAIAPLYAFNSKTLTGVGDINYHILGKNNKITLGLGAKRFSFEGNEKFNVTKSYSKITPSISIEFGDKPLSKFTHKLSFRHLIINEDELQIDSVGYKGKSNVLSNINELSYSGLLKNALGNTSFRLAIEQQSYKSNTNDENYLKTTLEIKRSFAYRTKKSIYIRLFAGGFLSHTGKTSGSFFGERSRGSLGLMSRGLYDYRYDDYYLGRNEKVGLISQQINPNTEGGMKIILPSGSETGIGYSNSFIGALNLKFDAPIDLPLGLNLRPYLDLGYYDDTRPLGVRPTYRTPDGEERFSDSYFISGGLSLEIGDYLGIYIPLYFSGSESDPNGLSNSVKQRGDFASRISFNLNLKALNPLAFIKKMVDSF
jgi:Peptidase family M1 domain